MVRRLLASLLVVLVAVACALPAVQRPESPREIAPPAVPPIAGTVDLAALYGSAADRGVKASMSEVGLAATVSLIDPGTSKTVATTLSTDTGRFLLNFGGGFLPGSKVYYLEAVKGLSAGGAQNRAGANAARIRTFLQFAGGWQSTTGSTITISRGTTAIAIIASLVGTRDSLDLSKVIGKVDGQTNAFDDAGTGISQAAYTTVFDLTTWALGADQDPVASIALDTRDGTFFRMPTSHAVSSVSPTGVLTPGTTLTLFGAGFSGNPADNNVIFQGGGKSFTVTPASTNDIAIDRSWIKITTPAGIPESGQLFVQIGGVVAAGPSYGAANSKVRDGTLTAGTDLEVQYSPLAAGQGYLKGNWDTVQNAVSYKMGAGTTPGSLDLKDLTDVGNSTSGTLTGVSVSAGGQYYLTVVPVYPWGEGNAQSSNGIRIAEAYSWDGRTEYGKDDKGADVLLRNVTAGGYSKDFPAGSGWVQVYGTHSFETIDIPAGVVVHVQPFGKVDQIAEGASMADEKVSNPKDGWVALYANSISVAGTIEADGRGYGGGGGGSGGDPGVGGDAAAAGRGGAKGLSGDGGTWNSGAGGKGAGGGGGGAVYDGCGGGPAAGGNGGARGGGGGAASNNSGGQNGASDGSGGQGNANEGGPGVLPYGGGPGGLDWNLVGGTDNKAGSGGAGYGAGGGGACPGCGANPGGGGGGGGTGGKAFAGLGWSPAANTAAGDGRGGDRGEYGPLPAGDDLSFHLGSGGAGGNGMYGGWENTGGAGGGAGGGAILLVSSGNLAVSGRLSVVGAAGGGGAANNAGGSGGGGGGSGGTIILSGKDVNITGVLEARGGNAGSSRNGYSGGKGGNGGATTASGGVIKVLYKQFAGSEGNLAFKVFTTQVP